jgi:hypothetical protein
MQTSGRKRATLQERPARSAEQIDAYDTLEALLAGRRGTGARSGFPKPRQRLLRSRFSTAASVTAVPVEQAWLPLSL